MTEWDTNVYLSAGSLCRKICRVDMGDITLFLLLFILTGRKNTIPG